MPYSPSPFYEPSTLIEFFDDFLFGCAAALSTSGTSSVAGGNDGTAVDLGGHPGIITLATGTTTTGRGTVAWGGAGITQLLLGFGTVTMEYLVYVNDALSDGTDTYFVYVGINDSLIATGTDMVAFRYTHSANSGRWECVTRSNGVETAADSGITVNTTTWYKLRIEINADATSVVFYIDGSPVATNTTNIPTGVGRQSSPGVGIAKSAGTNTRRLLVDYIYGRIALTTAR